MKAANKASTSAIAKVARVTMSDVINYRHSVKRRMRYVSPEKQRRIAGAMDLSQTELVKWHFENSKEPLTQVMAGQTYGIGRLSERVRELNERWKCKGEKTRIRNTEPQGIGIQARYVLTTGDDNA